MQSLRLHSLPHPWFTGLVTFALAALAAASVGYWALKWPAPATPLQAEVSEPAVRSIDSAQVAQLLGATSASASAAPTLNLPSKYKLLGVIAVGPHGGSALIAIDGLPPKPYRVGDHLTDDLLLQSVQARSATLAASMQGAGTFTLELPSLFGAP